MNRYSYENINSLSIANSKNYLILFIIWPFLAFIVAIANYNVKEAKNVVYFFLIYYGFCFVIANDSNVDAVRYASNLKLNSTLPFSDFFKIVAGLYSDTTVDIAEPLISFLVSRLTIHHGLYFAVWAAIFGFFYLRSLNLLYTRYHETPGWNSMIIMAFFILTLPITSISGVRMWTAAWIFFYGAYHVVLNREPKFLLIALASCLVHWSFISANAILLIYFFVGNRNVIYIPIALMSFLFPQSISPLFQSLSMKLGGGLQNRFDGYSSEDYLISIHESSIQNVWFMQVGNNLVFYYLLLAIGIIQLRFGPLMKGKDERNLFSFLLLFLSFVNFGMPIPSFGGRFLVLFFLFATLYIFLFFLKLPGYKISPLTILGLFPMFLFAAITFRLGSESLSAWIFTPGLGIPLFFKNLSISEFLFK